MPAPTTATLPSATVTPLSWTDQDDLRQRCLLLRAVAVLDIQDLASLTMHPTKGKMSKAAWTTYMSRSMLQVLDGRVRIGAANPDGWRSDWGVEVTRNGSQLQLVDGPSIQLGGNAHNWRARSDLKEAINACGEQPLGFEVTDGADLADGLERRLIFQPLGGNNGEVEFYVPVPPWLTHQTTMALPADCAAAFTYSELSVPVDGDAYGRRIPLSGGRAGLDASLLVGDSQIQVQVPRWTELAEATRQRLCRAILGALRELANSLPSDAPADWQSCLLAWEEGVRADHARARETGALAPYPTPNDPAPILPLHPGARLPIGVEVTRRTGHVDEQRLRQIASTAVRWITTRDKHWQWRALRIQDFKRIELRTGPLRWVDDAGIEPALHFGDEYSSNLIGAAQVAPSARRTSWRVTWSRPASDRWRFQADVLTKIQSHLVDGCEYVAYLQALCWLIQETLPDHQADVLWLKL